VLFFFVGQRPTAMGSFEGRDLCADDTERANEGEGAISFLSKDSLKGRRIRRNYNWEWEKELQKLESQESFSSTRFLRVSTTLQCSISAFSKRTILVFSSMSVQASPRIR
jgi:hypothetical protein